MTRFYSKCRGSLIFLKKYFWISLLFISINVHAQDSRFTEIDSFASSIGYYPADELAVLLTKPYTKELDKVRSLFYWVATHISYDVEKYHHIVDMPVKWTISYEDSAVREKRLISETLSGKKGVCADYASLFKSLCDYSGIRSEVVIGKVRQFSDTIGKDPKGLGHAWNAVMIDNSWYLLDATWAAGYTDEKVTNFKFDFNEYYFLTDPELLKFNHYPDDEKWWFTKDRFSFSDFINFPIVYFAYNSLIKPIGFKPELGVIKIRSGDKFQVHLKVPDTASEVFFSFETPRVDTIPFVPRKNPRITPPKSYVYIPVSDQGIDDIFRFANETKGKVQKYIPPDVAEKRSVINGDTIVFDVSIKSRDVNFLDIYYDNTLVLRYAVKVEKSRVQ